MQWNEKSIEHIYSGWMRVLIDAIKILKNKEPTNISRNKGYDHFCDNPHQKQRKN